MDKWFMTDQGVDLPTPALLVYPDRIRENIARMIKMAGSPDKLRPHVKTHKMSEIIRLKKEQGLTKFKCSTIAEAEMVAKSGGKDVMLAMQPVGAHITRFFSLLEQYPDSCFSTIADNERIIEQIAMLACQKKQVVDLWLDINNGMDRTGIRPGKEAIHLCLKISHSPCLNFRGLHVYDGHIHDKVPADRQIRCDRDFEPVKSLIQEIIRSGLADPVIVAGGTPTFPIHAVRENTETSPGTCVLWDSGYGEQYPDLDFLPAAVILMRVVSKPGPDLLCLDLGHKAIAAEMPHPRIRLLGIHVRRFVNHSEEHLVIDSSDAEKFKQGDLLYGIPWHICPTVPRYQSAYVIEGRKVTGVWSVDARDRMITI